MKPYLFFIFLLSAVLITLSCKDSITNPEPQPGRRDYVWTVDTLKSAFNYFFGMWGSAPNDVWTVGPSGDSQSRLWHFDGKSWNPYTKEDIICSGNGLWGSAWNNIWMVGSEGKIWRYNGNIWGEYFVYKQDDGFADIMHIWGRNSNDIYATGVINLESKKEQRGFVLHYNGVKWEEYYKADYISQFYSVKGDKENVLISGLRLIFGPGNLIREDSTYILKINGKKLEKVFAQGEARQYRFSLATIGGKLHVLLNNTLNVYKNGELKPVLELNVPANFAYGVYGRNYKDIFLNMHDGISHYNGTDITYLYKFDSIFSSFIGSPADFGNEIFFSIPATRKLRGILK